MAAPSGITWGSTVGDKGRIGIYAGVTHTATQTKVTIEVWFWSKWSVRDSSNQYYYNAGSSSATTLIGSKNISTTSDSGGWSTVNQIRLAGPTSYTYNKTSSAQTKYFAAKLTGIEAIGGTMTVSKSISVPALAKYTVSYNANGGSGAPGSQTKRYGSNLTLSVTKPTRTGYTFNGWSTSSSGSVSYQPGSTYTGNANLTLYAIWTPYTYTVSYNANGGSGAPNSQTKTYGVNLTLSSSKPTRTNYNFLGWSTSASGGVVYSPGSTYSSNSAVTLYAVWQLAYVKPRISGFTASRANASGVSSDSGTYGIVSFNWATDKTVTAVYIQWRASESTTWSNFSVGGSGTSGTVSKKAFGSGGISTETSYIVRVYVSDSGGTTYSSELTLGTIKYPMDVKANGTGIAFGKVAEYDNIFDVGWAAQLRSTLTVTGNTTLNGTLTVNGGVAGQLTRSHTGGSWIQGRNTAMIRNGGYSTGSFCSMVAMATPVGYWSIGTLGENLYFSYTTNANYNAGSNVAVSPYIGPDGKYNGKASSADWASGAGYANSIDAGAGSKAKVRNSLEINTRGLIDEVGPGSSGTLSVPQIGNGTGDYVKNLYILAGYTTSSGTGYVCIGNKQNRLYFEPVFSNSSYNAFFRPRDSGKCCLGTSDRRWYCVYTANSVNVSSDRRLKENIKYFNDDSYGEIYEQVFNNLKPATFTMKDDPKQRLRLGFIAQDVLAAINDIGMDVKDVDFITRGMDADEDNENTMLGLAYEQFIPIVTYMLQRCLKKVEEQEQEIQKLKKEGI